MERSERAYFLGALGGASSRILSIVSGVLALWLLTRILSAEAFASYSVAMSVVILASYTVGLGLERAMLVRIGSERPDKGRLAGARMMIRIAATTAGLSILAAFALLLFSDAAGEQLGWFLNRLAPVIPATALSLVLINWYQANHRVGISRAMQGLNDGSRTLVFALCFIFGWGASGVAAGSIIGAVAPLAFLSLGALGNTSPGPSALRIADFLAGLQFLTIRLSQMALQHIGIIAIGALGTAHGTIEYVVAWRFAQLIDSGKTFFAPTFAPRVRRHMAMGQIELAAREYMVARVLGFNGALAAAIVFVLLGRPLLGLFGGLETGYSAFLVLAAAYLLSVGVGLHVTFLSMSENLIASTINRATSLTLFVGALFILIPRFDSLGAALAFLVTAAVHETVGVWLLWRCTGIRALELKDAILLGFAMCAILAVATGTVSPAVGGLTLSVILVFNIVRERRLIAGVACGIVQLVRGRG